MRGDSAHSRRRGNPGLTPFKSACYKPRDPGRAGSIQLPSRHVRLSSRPAPPEPVRGPGQDAAAALPEEAAMLGRKSSKPQATVVAQESPAGPKQNGGPLLTIVGSSAKLEGKFEIADSIQIECEVGGELSVGGKLVIGEKGVVNANVQTVDAIVMGVYEGNMVATGNVETDSLVISKGGFFNGNVVKSKGDDGARGPRPVYLVDGARAVTAQR